MPITITGWDFSTSWASNITTVGAVLGTFLAASLPSSGLFSGMNYAALNVLFGLLTAGAAFYYVATRQPTTDDQYQGTIKSFVIASCLTLWAVGGELITLGLLAVDIEVRHGSPTFSYATAAILVAVLLALLYLVGLYAWRTIEGTIYWTVHDRQAAPIAAAALPPGAHTAAPPAPQPAAHRKPPRPRALL